MRFNVWFQHWVRFISLRFKLKPLLWAAGLRKIIVLKSWAWVLDWVLRLNLELESWAWVLGWSLRSEHSCWGLNFVHELEPYAKTMKLKLELELWAWVLNLSIAFESIASALKVYPKLQTSSSALSLRLELYFCS